MDPKENHGLGTYPLRQLLVLWGDKAGIADADLADMIYNPDNDYRDIRLSREEITANRKRIDIFGECDSFVLAIENKINSKEHDQQTDQYYNFIENKYKNVERRIYIFLSPKGEKAINQHFINISYQELYDEVLDKCLNNPMLNDDVKSILKDYIANIKKAINIHVNKILCNEIFNKYGEILNLLKTAVESGEDTPVETAFYNRYSTEINEILAARGERIIIRTDKIKGYAVLEKLYQNGKIKDGDEFFCKYGGHEVEADVVIGDGVIKLIVGYKNNGEYVDTKESFSGAYNRICKEIKGGKVSGNGNDIWKNKDGKTPNDLLKEILK